VKIAISLPVIDFSTNCVFSLCILLCVLCVVYCEVDDLLYEPDVVYVQMYANYS